MNTEALMQQDAISRQKIVSSTSSNFFVEAGAGSGKTTILVKRMVAMIEQGIDVSKICAITFTKAAAGEFYARFQQKLIERSTAETEAGFVPTPGELDNPTDISRARCLSALNNIDLCFMGTIDSFCNMLLSEHPAKANIPSNASVLSDEEMAAQYKQAYSRIQRGEYGSELQQLCNHFRSFHARPDEVFLGSIGKMMDTRSCKHMFTPAPSADVDTILGKKKAQALRVLKILLDHPELRYDKQEASRKAWKTLHDKQKLLFSPWQDNISQVMSALKAVSDIRLLPESDLTIFAAECDWFQSHLRGTKISWYEFQEGGIDTLYNHLRNLQYAVTMEFMEKAAEEIANSLRKEGKLTFFDYLLYLRDVLKEDARDGGQLIRHIHDRHSYFLIDEFQDTNPMQAEVFFYLSAQNPQPDWRKCIPYPGSLFIVGDPKQSIYRFRYADVSSFLRVKEMFTGEVGEVLCLTRNFRSAYKMRSWFNDTFRSLLPESTPLQCKYEPIPLEPAPVPDGTFSGVYSYTVSTAQCADPENTDPARVAKIIQRIVGNPAYMIQEPGDGEKRMVSYQDIMLITPRKTKMASYIQAFTRQEIPFRIEGKVIFSNCPSLVSICQILAAVANPNSRQYLYGALMCKRLGFTLNELHRLKRKGYHFNIYADNEDVAGAARINAAMKRLKDLVFRSHSMGVAALFTVILEELEIFQYVSAVNMEYLYFALELLRSAESSGKFASLPQAVSFLERLINDTSDSERSISLTRNENRVHIANLHKVKGLEAPVVILADPYTRRSTPDIRVLQQEPVPLCWIFEIKQNNVSLLSCSGFESAKEAETACLEAEQKRLLYVAATRARRVLIVADAVKSNDSSDDQSIWKFFVDRSQGDFFECLPVGKIMDAKPKNTVRAQDLYIKGQQENTLVEAASAISSYEINRPSQLKIKGRIDSEDNFEDEASENIRSNIVRKNSAVIGTLVHRLMESLVSSRDQVDLEPLVREILSEYEAEGDFYRVLLINVGTAIRSGGFPQETQAPQDILRTLLTADEVYCEVPFCRRTERSIWHGIMDVVYRIGTQWFILDYKTNAEARDLDVKYQEQLSAYVEAFRELTGHTPQPLIYHIDV